jgi:hypothetical protein
VPRSWSSRFVAALLALIAGLVVPGSAVAHGVAHHEAHEHKLAHGENATPVGAVIDHGDGATGHGHPQFAYASSKRPESAPPATVVPCGTTVTLDLTIVSPAARIIVAAARPRADPAHAPPPRPRAPPCL